MSDTSEARAVPQQVRSAARRANLLDAAREVVREEGIDKTTTAKIAERAEASIGTVYRYWTDVHAILDEILPGRRQTHDVLLERAEQVAAGYTPEHDDEHGAHGLLSLGVERAIAYGNYGAAFYESRRLLVQSIALGLAALEAHDRANGVTS